LLTLNISICLSPLGFQTSQTRVNVVFKRLGLSLQCLGLGLSLQCLGLGLSLQCLGLGLILEVLVLVHKPIVSNILLMQVFKIDFVDSEELQLPNLSSLVLELQVIIVYYNHISCIVL